MKRNNSMEFENIIDNSNVSLSSEARRIIKYKDLIFLFVRRNMVMRYKQTIIGPAWILLSPLINSIVYAVIFGGVAHIGTDGVPQLLFYIIGSSIWTLFSTTLVESSNSFISNAGIYGKVYFPRMCIPISIMVTAIVNFAIQLLLFGVVYLIYFVNGANIKINLIILLCPITILQIGLMALGCGIVISSLTTKYRDLAMLVSFGVQLWMYLSPVVYPISNITGKMRTLLLANPICMPIEIIRHAFFSTGNIEWISYIWSWFFTIAILLLGLRLFGKIEKTFIDTV